MAKYFALSDKRLNSGVPARSDLYSFNTNESTSLRTAFSSINACALGAGEKLHTLFILCHGYAGVNRRAMVSMDAGGMGLQLGREDVLHQNVSMWTSIANMVDNIVVYSCAAANTEYGNEGTSADGRYLMGALAIHTNSTVYAANRIQWYHTPNGQYDFGAWEGQLYQFLPNGNPPTMVAGPPVEFSDVMNGTAP